MKSKFILGLTLLLLTLNVLHSQKTDAGAILDKTSQKYSDSEKGMEITFTANLRSTKNGVNESYEGTLSTKGDRFMLNTPDMKSWFNGKTLWMYMLHTQEVNVSNPSGDELQFLNPLLFLRSYKKDFTVSCTGESTSQNNKMAYDIVMTPKKKNDTEKIELQIEKSTSLPSRVVVYMKNDVRNSIIIKGINFVNIPEARFVFPEKDFPGVEIVDLR